MGREEAEVGREAAEVGRAAAEVGREECWVVWEPRPPRPSIMLSSVTLPSTANQELVVSRHI